MAVDAVDPSVVTLVANGAVARAASGKRIWTFLPDGVTSGLLPTADGGVIALNVGAAARRFDAAGNLLWTVGYGAEVGDVGAMMGDNLLLADRDAVRRIDPTGAPIWSRVLGAGPDTPYSNASVTAATSDRAGGAWIVGTVGGLFPPWLTADTPPQMGPAGPFVVTPDTPLEENYSTRKTDPFILHLDATGTVVGGGAWITPVSLDQAVLAVDAAGQPMLVARGERANGSQLASAFDATGALLWTQQLQGPTTLAVDGAGRLFAISLLLGDTPPSVQIQQWDPAGAVVASVPAPVTLSAGQGFQVATAPTPDGFVAVGEVTGEEKSGSDRICTDQHDMFRFQTQTMTATSVPLGGF